MTTRITSTDIKEWYKREVAEYLVHTVLPDNSNYTVYTDVPAGLVELTNLPTDAKSLVSPKELTNTPPIDLLVCKGGKAILCASFNYKPPAPINMSKIILSYLPHCSIDISNTPPLNHEFISECCDNIMKKLREAEQSVSIDYSYALHEPLEVEDIAKKCGAAHHCISELLKEKGLIKNDDSLTIYGKSMHMFFKYSRRYVYDIERMPVIAKESKDKLIEAITWNLGTFDKSLKSRLSRLYRAEPSDDEVTDKLIEYIDELLNMPLEKYFSAAESTREDFDSLLLEADSLLPFIKWSADTYHDAIRLCHTLRNEGENCSSVAKGRNLEDLNKKMLLALSKPLCARYQKLHKQFSKTEETNTKGTVLKKEKEVPLFRQCKRIQPPQHLPPCFVLSDIPLAYYFHAACRRAGSRYAYTLYKDTFEQLMCRPDACYSFACIINYVHECEAEGDLWDDVLTMLLAMLVDPICLPFDINQNNNKNI